jgi:hypothetical protein
MLVKACTKKREGAQAIITVGVPGRTVRCGAPARRALITASETRPAPSPTGGEPEPKCSRAGISKGQLKRRPRACSRTELPPPGRRAKHSTSTGNRPRRLAVRASPDRSESLCFQCSWYSRMLRNAVTDRRRHSAFVDRRERATSAPLTSGTPSSRARCSKIQV